MGKVFHGNLGCEVEVILDSVSNYGIRLLTVRLRYWRPIHSELMTHRVFSRNARSSRAVPVVTLLKEEPYTPHFLKNQPGMQAFEEMDPVDLQKAQIIWHTMIEQTRGGVRALHELGVHKQWANRPLEWFGWIDVLVTSTDWANWFALRDHPAAAPEIHDLAETMTRAFNASEPKLLQPGEWHLPYITEEELEGAISRARFYNDRDEAFLELKILSAARCARISYVPFDGEPSPVKERERYNKLVGDSPVHASPTEHQATPDYKIELNPGKGQVIEMWANGDKQGNFTGWCQARKYIPGEAEVDPHNAPSF